MEEKTMAIRIAQLFKKWIVKRPNGQCQILFALAELDGFVDEILLEIDDQTTGEKCQICGKHYDYVYEVSDKLWRKITGIKNGSGLRCIGCLTKEASKKNIKLEISMDKVIDLIKRLDEKEC